MRRGGYSRRVKQSEMSSRQRHAARPLMRAVLCIHEQRRRGSTRRSWLAGLGFSGAAMKISIPSRASSLLQPGGARVVGEGQRQSNQALATRRRSNKHTTAIPLCARLQGP